MRDLRTVSAFIAGAVVLLLCAGVTACGGTGQPTGDAQPGKVTSREDFSNPAKHRFGDETTEYAVGRVVGGSYRLTLTKAGMPHGEAADVSPEATTVSLALDMWTAEAYPGSWIGPLCFYQYGYGFSLRLHADGAYELVQFSLQGDVMATLASGTTTAPVPGHPVRLRLDCEWAVNASTVTGWVGQVQVGPAQDQAGELKNFFRDWRAIGFWAMSPQVPAVVQADNAVFSEAS